MKERKAKLVFTRNILRGEKGLTKSLFSQILEYLPKDTRILGFYEHCNIDSCGILVESQSFKEIGEVEMLPLIEVTFHRTPFGLCVEDVDMNAALEEKKDKYYD